MDGWKKFKEASVSPKDVFYSRLNMKGISDEDHEHAEQVWNIMEKKTLGYFHNTDLKIGLLLLADVFEAFWNTCLKNYKFDLAHFYTLPGLAWQTLLKTATEYYEHEKRRKDYELCLDEFKFELLIDINMLLIFEKSIRGGITQAVKRYVKANNKYMEDLCNPDEVSIYLQYIDANSEHGWYFNVIMVQSLKMKRQNYLKNILLIFEEQQQNTSILIQLLRKPLTKSW